MMSKCLSFPRKRESSLRIFFVIFLSVSFARADGGHSGAARDGLRLEKILEGRKKDEAAILPVHLFLNELSEKEKALEILKSPACGGKEKIQAIETLKNLKAAEHSEPIARILRERHRNLVCGEEENLSVKHAAFKALEAMDQQFLKRLIREILFRRDLDAGSVQEDLLILLKKTGNPVYAGEVARGMRKARSDKWFYNYNRCLSIEVLGAMKAASYADLVAGYLMDVPGDCAVSALVSMNRADLVERKALELLRSENQVDHLIGVRFLGLIGARRHAALAVRYIHQDPAGIPAFEAIQALGKMRAREYTQDILNIVKDQNTADGFLHQALLALGRMGALDSDPETIAYLEGPIFWDKVKGGAIVALADIGQKKFYGRIVQAAPGLKWWDFVSAIRAMEVLGSKEENLKHLSDLLEHDFNSFEHKRDVIRALHRADPVIARDKVRSAIAGLQGSSRLELLRALSAQKELVLIDEVFRILEEPDPDAAYWAASALFEWDKKAAEARLASFLLNSNSRLRTLQLLNRLYSIKLEARNSLRKEVQACLEDPDKAVRLEAVRAFESMSDPWLSAEFVASLVGRLEDLDGKVREAAFDVLMPARHSGVQAALTSAARLMKRQDPAFRVSAVQMMDKMTDLYGFTAEPFPFLIAALKDEEPEVRARALSALARHADKRAIWDAAPQAAEIIQGEPESLRLEALKFLRQVGFHRQGRQYADNVAAVLEDPSPRVRLQALETLKVLGSQKHGPAVQSRLKDADISVRLAALETYAVLMKSFVWFGTIAEFLADEDARMRSKALSLFENTAGVKVAVKKLKENLEHANPSIRRDALRGLAKLEGVVHAPSAARLLEDKSKPVRVAALESLAELKATTHAGAVSKILRDADPQMRSHAFKTLKAMGEDAVKKHVWEILTDRDVMRWEDRKRLIETLGDAAASEFAPWVRLCIEDKDDRIVQAALDALKNMNRVDLGRGRVADLLAHPRKRGLMLITLSHPRYADYAQEVRRLLKYPDPSVRQSAEVTLEKMGTVK